MTFIPWRSPDESIVEYLIFSDKLNALSNLMKVNESTDDFYFNESKVLWYKKF